MPKNKTPESEKILLQFTPKQIQIKKPLLFFLLDGTGFPCSCVQLYGFHISHAGTST
jgi:hypothetical protein